MHGKSLFLIPLLTLGICQAESRTWTRVSDGKSLEAKYVSQDIDAKTVTISTNGKEFTLPADTFSGADTEYLEQQALAEVELKKLEQPIGKPVSESHSHPDAVVKTWHSYLPATYSQAGIRSPVCFVYSSGGNSKSVMDKIQTVSDELGWVLIGIDTYKNHMAEKGDGKQRMIDDSKKIVEAALKKFHLDPDRVVFSGMSGGAWWSYHSTHAVYPQAKGVIAFGGWLYNEHDMPYPKDLAIAMVNGSSDKGATSWEERDSAALKRKKADVKVFHFPGGHEIAPPDVALEAARWIHETKDF